MPVHCQTPRTDTCNSRSRHIEVVSGRGNSTAGNSPSWRQGNREEGAQSTTAQRKLEGKMGHRQRGVPRAALLMEVREDAHWAVAGKVQAVQSQHSLAWDEIRCECWAAGSYQRSSVHRRASPSWHAGGEPHTAGQAQGGRRGEGHAGCDGVAGGDRLGAGLKVPGRVLKVGVRRRATGLPSARGVEGWASCRACCGGWCIGRLVWPSLARGCPSGDSTPPCMPGGGGQRSMAGGTRQWHTSRATCGGAVAPGAGLSLQACWHRRRPCSRSSPTCKRSSCRRLPLCMLSSCSWPRQREVGLASSSAAAAAEAESACR